MDISTSLRKRFTLGLTSVCLRYLLGRVLVQSIDKVCQITLNKKADSYPRQLKKLAVVWSHPCASRTVSYTAFLNNILS